VALNKARKEDEKLAATIAKEAKIKECQDLQSAKELIDAEKLLERQW
jgi:hypothetical protein